MQYNTKSCCLSTCRTGNANNRETTTTSRISLDANEQSSLCLGLCLCCCCCCNMVRHMQSTQKGSVSAALEHKRKRLSDTQYTDRQAPTQTHMLIAYATLHSVCSIQVDFVSSSASAPNAATCCQLSQSKCKSSHNKIQTSHILLHFAV